MTQPTDSDFSTPSGASGTSIRTDRNEMFEGLLTKLSGTTAPATTFPFMWWIDTSQSPPDWNLRNAADDAWLTFATIDPTTGIALLSGGQAVVGLGNTSDFTAAQRVKVAGAAASWTITTDLDTGLASFLDLGGENAANEEVVGARMAHRITSNVDGAENSECDLRVMRSGTLTTKLTLGDVVTVSGTLNATTVQQGGTGVSTLIENAISAAGVPTTTATAVTVPGDLTAGDINTFTGSSASTYTIDSGTAGEVFGVLNDGTADITFSSGTATVVGGTTLGQQQIATIFYRSATRVFIYGQNT